MSNDPYFSRTAAAFAPPPGAPRWLRAASTRASAARGRRGRPWKRWGNCNCWGRPVGLMEVTWEILGKWWKLWENLGKWWKFWGKLLDLGKTMHIGEVKDNSWKNESELRHFFVFEMGLKASRIVLNPKWIFRAEFCWSKMDLQIGRLFDGCWVLDRFRMFGQYLIMNTVDPLGMG